MKRSTYLLPAALFLSAASGAFAASCGTVASPTACSITLGGDTQFNASAFSLVIASGTKLYQASDILIDLSVSGGDPRAAILTFSKNSNGPTPGGSFFVNSNETAAFTVSYNAAIAPVSTGTVAFTGASITAPMSNAANGSAAVQFSIPSMAVCNVFVAGSNSQTCTLPPGLGTATSAGDIISLNGNTGNAAILNFQNVYVTSFTAAPTSGVPEPTSFALLGLGLSGLAWFRRRAAR